MVTKKKIQWKAGMRPTGPKPNRQQKPKIVGVSARREPKFSRVDENDKCCEQHVSHMCVGSLWQLSKDLTTLAVWDNNLNMFVPADCQLPILVECYRTEDARFPKGMIAVYTGHIYADEQANNLIVRVKRPTFVIANGRFIIKDLKNLEPVE